jgi:hypothetical protein
MRVLETLVGALLMAAGVAMAQAPPGAADLVNSQREAMKALAAMNGAWRGEATTLLPGGERRTLTQTERIGPFLDGSVKVIEGRGYDANGRVVFNSFGIISFDPATKTYSLRSYAHGRKGDFPLRPNADGYAWEVPAGPGAIVRYTATIKDNRLHEVGDRIVGGAEPVRVFEMRLERIGDTDWPEQGALAPR